MAPNKELKKFYFDSIKFKYLRCLEPLMECKNKPIRAHSVQNSRILDLLVEKGHVVLLGNSLNPNKPPKIKWEKKGRNRATTFTGLCEGHDNSLFSRIDKEPFDLQDSEQLFLFAYRAVCKELHDVLEWACKIQGTYMKRVDLGLDPKDGPSEAGLFATDYLVKSYETWRYRNHFFDKFLLSKDFQKISHRVTILEGQKPVLAVCSLFSLDHLTVEDDVPRLTLNIFPINENRTAVIFGYPNTHQKIIEKEIEEAFVEKGDSQKNILSKIILNNCGNFIVSPPHYRQWKPEKRKAIVDYFSKTLFSSDYGSYDSSLNLFQ